MTEFLERGEFLGEFENVDTPTQLTVSQLLSQFERCIDAVLKGKVFQVSSVEGFSAILELASSEDIKTVQKASRNAFVNNLPEFFRRMKEDGPIQIEGESSNIVFRLLEPESQIDSIEGSRLLRALRKSSGLSQRELSKRSGVSHVTIANLEMANGRRPRIGTLKKLFFTLKSSRKEREPILTAYGLQEPDYTLLNPPEYVQPIDELELQGDEKVDEIWVAGEPMECASVDLEERVADLIQKGKQYVYWVPKHVLPKMLRFITRLNSVYKLDAEKVERHVKLIQAPDALGVISCALYFQWSELRPLLGRYVRNDVVCSLDHVELEELNDLLQTVYFGITYGKKDPRYMRVFPT